MRARARVIVKAKARARVRGRGSGKARVKVRGRARARARASRVDAVGDLRGGRDHVLQVELLIAAGVARGLVSGQ